MKTKIATDIDITLPAHSVGALTFMLTDMESSTRLWEAYPRNMKDVLDRHDALIEAAVQNNAGLVVKPRGEGDSRFAVFNRASDAVLAAAEIQRQMAQESWSIPENIRIRIALHTGEAELRDDDYYGSTVNRCARLRSIAHGGQTLLSQITYDLAHELTPAGYRFLDLGKHKLKDIKRPERVFQLIAPGLQADFPPLRTPIRWLQNLPISLTSFVGRESEVAEITNLISDRRLVTILGPGGVGKTRLAVQATSAAAKKFSDGGWFVDFTLITNPELVTQHVMTTLGVYEDNCCSPSERLEYFFHGKSMLLILDNCEHVMPGVTQLVKFLLRNTDGLTILATSREPLGVVGETDWYIGPLSTPKFSEDLSPESLMNYEAAALFVERASAISDFALTRENAMAVAQVCARLDGIPLALELAAARTKVLSAEELADRLENQFNLLVSDQNVPQRQKTMRNLIDWSYDLLPEKERILFQRLSIFAGGFTLKMIEEIGADDRISSNEIIDLLIHLVDRSLVISESIDKSKRYRLLETIRQYGRDRLQDGEEYDILARKHAAYFTGMAEESAVELMGRHQGACLRNLEVEHDNFRAALEWMSDHQDMSEMALQLSSALWPFWRIRGHYREGRLRLELAIYNSSDAPKATKAEALRGAAVLALEQGDYSQATHLIEESLALYQQLGNKPGIGRAQDVMGEIAYYQGDYSGSIAFYEQSLALRTKIDDRAGQANSLRQLGIIAREQGDYQLAEVQLTRSLELCRQLDDRILLARVLDNVGLVAQYWCDYDRANQLFSEAISIYKELNDRLGISNSLQNLGNVSKDQGMFREAQAFYDDCFQLKQEIGDQRGTAQTLANLAELAFYQGKYITAEHLAGKSLAHFKGLGVKRGIIFTLGLLAYTAHYNGRFDEAAELADECLQLAMKLRAPRPIAYCKEIFGLIAYARNDLEAARSHFLESAELFDNVGDHRNVANAKVNLARTLYRQGDTDAAHTLISESLAISRKLNLRWILSVALEISGLIQRSQHKDEAALVLFQESLNMSIDQDNQQGIANCLGAIAGLAVIANQAWDGVALFAAAEKIRQEIGAGMGRGDQAEYSYYLELARLGIAENEFKAAWERGLGLTLDQLFEITRIQAPGHILSIVNRMEVNSQN